MKKVLGALIWCWLICPLQADPFWQELRAGRPQRARASLQRPSLLQEALLSFYGGQVGEAWQALSQLERQLKPGQQPPEFFWLRAVLLFRDNWDLAFKNLEPLFNSHLRLEALLLSAQGFANSNPERSRTYWREALLLAQDQADSALTVRLALTQARMQSLQGRWEEALGTLLTARRLAESNQLPALVSRVERVRAELLAQLGDWPGFAQACWSCLKWARLSGEVNEVEPLCEMWVERQLSRRDQEAEVKHCHRRLQQAQSWLKGSTRSAVLCQQARLEALALNQRSRALLTLDQALKSTQGRSRLQLLAQKSTLLARLSQRSARENRRAVLLELMQGLKRLPELVAADPLRRQLPRYGCWAALAETYLPEEPAQAEEYFARAQAEASSPAHRLEILNFKLVRYNNAGALPWSRQTLGQMLELVKDPTAASDAGQILRAQMYAIRGESRLLTRLFLIDEIRPAPESPSLLVLKEILKDESLKGALEQDINQRLSSSRDLRERSEAYTSRAELLLAQGRWGEAQLALQRAEQTAAQGGWNLLQAQSWRSLAEINWQIGQPKAALEAVQQAENFYALSAAERDQRSAKDCRLLRIYFLLRQQQPQEALKLCDQSSPWMNFLRGRCLVALGQVEEARKIWSETHLEEGLPEIGRLYYLARYSPPPQALELYATTYARAEELGSLVVRDIALAWSAELRKQGSLEQAQAVLDRAGQKLRLLLEEYPAQVREGLLDQPSTQRVLGSSGAASPPLENPGPVKEGSNSPRQSRREFLARINTWQQRYPGLEAALAVSPSELAALQESLPEGRVLLQYYCGQNDLLAMVLDRQQCRLVQVAVELGQLQQWSSSLRQALMAGREPDPGDCRSLYSTLVEPLALPQGQQVQLIPNNFLWYLPWDVLQDRQGRWLCQNFDWSCLSPAELLNSGVSANNRRAPIRRALTLGGINPRLPGTAREALKIAQLFPEGQSLLGAEATLAQLSRLAPQAQLLHLATHSALKPELNQTFIELADGPLTLEKIYGLTLAPGAVVVLSSCESALGQSSPGREVASLASAFKNSGAGCVIATLWKVEDAASEEFFSHFYRNLVNQLPPSRALQQARLDSLSLGASCWGAYQLVGDPG